MPQTLFWMDFLPCHSRFSGFPVFQDLKGLFWDFLSYFGGCTPIWMMCSESPWPVLRQSPSSLCPGCVPVSHQFRGPFSRNGKHWHPPVPSGHGTVCRDRLGSFTTASPWHCWLWRMGLAWQLFPRLFFPITHTVCHLSGPVQWTAVCFLPMVGSAYLWPGGTQA